MGGESDEVIAMTSESEGRGEEDGEGEGQEEGRNAKLALIREAVDEAAELAQRRATLLAARLQARAAQGQREQRAHQQGPGRDISASQQGSTRLQRYRDAQRPDRNATTTRPKSAMSSTSADAGGAPHSAPRSRDIGEEWDALQEDESDGVRGTAGPHPSLRPPAEVTVHRRPQTPPAADDDEEEEDAPPPQHQHRQKHHLGGGGGGEGPVAAVAIPTLRLGALSSNGPDAALPVSAPLLRPEATSAAAGAEAVRALAAALEGECVGTGAAARERQALLQLEEVGRLVLAEEAASTLAVVTMRCVRAAFRCAQHQHRQICELSRRVASAECEARGLRAAAAMMDQQKRSVEDVCSTDVLLLQEQLAEHQRAAGAQRAALQASFDSTLADVKALYEEEMAGMRGQLLQLREQLATREKSRERRERDIIRMSEEPAPATSPSPRSLAAAVRGGNANDSDGGGNSGGGCWSPQPSSSSPSPPRRPQRQQTQQQQQQPHAANGADGSGEWGALHDGPHELVRQVANAAHPTRRGHLYMSTAGAKWRKVYCVLHRGVFTSAESECAMPRTVFTLLQLVRVRTTAARHTTQFAFCFMVEQRPSPRSPTTVLEFACEDKHARHLWLEALSCGLAAARSPSHGGGGWDGESVASRRTATTAATTRGGRRAPMVAWQRAQQQRSDRASHADTLGDELRSRLNSSS